MRPKKIPNLDLTVGELKAGMNRLGVSAEQLAKIVPVSNMTIRRLQGKNDRELVPRKYAAHFLGALETGSAELVSVQDQIIESKSMVNYLIKLSSQEGSTQETKTKLQSKLKEADFDSGFLSKVKDLKKFAFQRDNLKVSLIALGALIYFINPIDLIPDYLGPIGYVDDLGVMTLALAKIGEITRRERT